MTDESNSSAEPCCVLHELLPARTSQNMTCQSHVRPHTKATCIQLQTSLAKSRGRVAFGYRRATSTYCRSGWLSVYAGTCSI